MRPAATLVLLMAATGAGCESTHFGRRSTVALATGGVVEATGGVAPTPAADTPPAGSACLPPAGMEYEPNGRLRPIRRALQKVHANAGPAGPPNACPAQGQPQGQPCQPQCQPPAPPCQPEQPKQPRDVSPPAPREVRGPTEQVTETRAASAAVTQDVLLVPRMVYMPYAPQIPVAPARLALTQPAARVTQFEERTREREVIAPAARDVEAKPSRDVQINDNLDKCLDAMRKLNQRIDDLENRASRAVVPPAQVQVPFAVPCSPKPAPYCPTPTVVVPDPTALESQLLPHPTPLPNAPVPAMTAPVPPPN